MLEGIRRRRFVASYCYHYLSSLPVYRPLCKGNCSINTSLSAIYCIYPTNQAFSSLRAARAYSSTLTPPKSQETLATYLPLVVSSFFNAESRSQQILSEATKRFPSLVHVSPQDAFRRLDLLGYLIAQARIIS